MAATVGEVKEVISEGRKADKFDRIWTPAKRKKVEGMFKRGASIVEVASFLRIVAPTVRSWIAKHDEFRDVVMQGLVDSEAWWQANARKNIKNREFQTSLFNSVMRNRFAWATSDREELPMSEQEAAERVQDRVDGTKLIEKHKQSVLDYDKQRAEDIEYEVIPSDSPPLPRGRQRSKQENV